MRTSIPLESQPARSQTSRKSLSPCVHTPLVVLAAITALFAAPLGAQTPASPAASKPSPTTTSTPAAQTPSKPAAPAPAHKPVHPHKHPGTAHLLTPPVQAAPVPVTPPTPEPPHWPANDKPADASVTWDSRGLLINAANSSLKQILNDVSAATGAKVEGLGADQRIFGAYGPGRARDVLSQLLEGSGYNVLMIGDQGEGTPRQIVLTARGGANTQTAANPAQPAPHANEEEPDPNDEPADDNGARRLGRHGPNDPGGPPRTPQQMQMDQRNNPSAPPAPPNQP